MEPHPHSLPINNADSLRFPEAGILADAFAEFVGASTRLEFSYECLQQELKYLSQELAERNVALKASLADNQRIHCALQQIVHSMPCGILVVEQDGSVSMINPEANVLLGLERCSAMTLDAISCEAEIDLAEFIKGNSIAGKEQEFCKITSSGKRWLSVHERCLNGWDELDGRGCKQTILILQDITLHKQAEEERERGRKASALSEVATILAHEIRNPLASMELFAGLIASGGEDVGEWISHLHAGIRSLAGTVNNVLTFHGAGYPCLAPLDLDAAIRSSVDFARPIADEAGISLVFDSCGSEMSARGNGSAMQQVVLNIVCNAIRHTKRGGSIRVSLQEISETKRAARPRAVIKFADTGSGILPDDLERIFRAGFSASGNTSGLGLAVCAQIIQQHEGTIRVESRFGVGTTFYVEMPIL